MEVKKVSRFVLEIEKEEADILTDIVLRTEGLTQEEEDFIDIFLEYSERLGGEKDGNVANEK